MVVVPRACSLPQCSDAENTAVATTAVGPVQWHGNGRSRWPGSVRCCAPANAHHVRSGSCDAWFHGGMSGHRRRVLSDRWRSDRERMALGVVAECARGEFAHHRHGVTRDAASRHPCQRVGVATDHRRYYDLIACTAPAWCRTRRRGLCGEERDIGAIDTRVRSRMEQLHERHLRLHVLNLDVPPAREASVRRPTAALKNRLLREDFEYDTSPLPLSPGVSGVTNQAGGRAIDGRVVLSSRAIRRRVTVYERFSDRRLWLLSNPRLRSDRVDGQVSKRWKE